MTTTRKKQLQSSVFQPFQTVEAPLVSFPCALARVPSRCPQRTVRVALSEEKRVLGLFEESSQSSDIAVIRRTVQFHGGLLSLSCSVPQKHTQINNQVEGRK